MTNINSSEYTECPAIFVSVADDTDAQVYRWVEVGAEEEGVPCRLVTGTGYDPVARAYAAALESRLSVGVGIAAGKAVLHEMHMPPEQPVLYFEIGSGMIGICRLMGTNAGRMVKRMPLRLCPEPELEPAPPATSPPANGSSEAHSQAPVLFDGRTLAETIARELQRRGII